MATSKKAKKPVDLKGLGSGGAQLALKSVQKRRALLIGINHYKELTPLQYAVRDVRAIKDALEGFLYEDIRILHDEAGPKQKPTYKNVVREFEAFVDGAERDDLLLVYFAGHGKMKSDKAWLFLSDSKWNEKKQWYDQVLSVEKLKSLLKRGASERLVLMLDACQTGEVGERDTVDPSERARFIRRAYEEAQGIAVFAGSSPGQKAQEIKGLRHGVFTHFVLDGLADKSLVDERTRLLTVSRLAAHVTQKLSKWRKKKSIYVQAPHLQMDGGDLALVDHTRKRRTELDNRPFPKLRELWRLEGHKKGEEIRHIATPPEGPRFLSVSDDGTARLWNAETGRAEGKPYRHGTLVWRASFSMDGRRFATLCGNNVVRLWTLGAARHTREIGQVEWVEAVAFAPDGRSLAVGAHGSVEFVDTRRDEWGEPATGHIGSVSAIAFLDSHEYMATGGDDGYAILWNYTTKEVLQVYPRSAREILFEDSTLPSSNGPAQPRPENDEGFYGLIRSISLSPDGRLLVTGGNDGDDYEVTRLKHLPRVWSTQSGELLYSIKEHTRQVTAVQFSPRNRVLLTASKDGTARLWQASNGKLLQTLDEPRIAITAASFSADGTRVILGYEDGSIRIFGPEAPSSPSKGSKKP